LQRLLLRVVVVSSGRRQLRRNDLAAARTPDRDGRDSGAGRGARPRGRCHRSLSVGRRAVGLATFRRRGRRGRSALRAACACDGCCREGRESDKSGTDGLEVVAALHQAVN
jgi:hypothetical protein